MTYTISDLHGCYDEFMEMLELINFGPTDKLYILGDVVDRGDQSLECLQYIMRTKNITLLAGNHEVLMLDYFNNRENAADRWFRNGGQATLGQLQALGTDECNKVLQYVRKLKFYKTLTVNKRRFFLSHAGYEASSPITKQTERNLTWSRDEFYKYPANNKYIAVFGHTPTVSLRKSLLSDPQGPERDIITDCSVWVDEQFKDKICIDSGCYYKGALAALRLDDGAVYYVKSSANTGLYSYGLNSNNSLNDIFVP